MTTTTSIKKSSQFCLAGLHTKF